MISRFFCLLLVPLMLANQGLGFAHTHHGTAVGEPEGHTSRPHFHSGGHGHHESTHDHHADHSHGNRFDRDFTPDDHSGGCESLLRPAVDHDADAVYCADVVILARDENSTIVPLTKNAAAVPILHGADQSGDGLLRLSPIRGEPAPVFDTACPIYLRTLSLRI